MSNNERKLKVSGHQTFPFRYGWLEKGVKFVFDGLDFNSPTAIVELGVGKNMVESIRYWCELAGLIEDGVLTDLSRALFLDKEAWDPYLEDNASLWLIHWKIATNQTALTSGGVLFSFLHKPEFTKRDVVEAVYRFQDQDDGKSKKLSEKILLRDVDCFIRCYSGRRKYEQRRLGEESFDCPMQELNLIQPMIDADMFRFSIGPKPSLPPEIIGYVLWDYLKNQGGKQSIRLQEALYHEFSPGQVFMLDENSLVDAVNSLNSDTHWVHSFRFVESAGIALIECTLDESGAKDLLNSYYRKGSAE